MPILRFLSEGLLQIAYRIAWAAFWGQGVAFGAAAFFAISSGGSSAWAAALRPSALFLGAIFVAGGLLMFFLSLKPGAPAVAGMEEPAPEWNRRSLLLCVSLCVLATAALVASRELVSLWREVALLLDRAGLFHELPAGGMMSGLVFAPLMVLLYTPLLLTCAAAALIALPVLLAVALAARSPRVGVLFTGAMVCCAVLVGASLVATDLFERLLALAEPTLRNDKDPMGAHVAGELQRGAAVLLRTGRAQGMVLLCHLAWLPSMLMSRRAQESPAAELEPVQKQA